MQVNRFKLVAAFGSAIGVLDFILILVGHHGIFYRQPGSGLVCHQRIVPGLTDRLVDRFLIYPQIDSKTVLHHRRFFHRAVCRRSAAFGVFISYKRIVMQGVLEKIASFELFQDLFAGTVNGGCGLEAIGIDSR